MISNSRKLLSISVSVLLFAASVLTVFLHSEVEVYAEDEDRFNIYVNGQRLNSGTKKGGQGWSYDDETQTLILDGAKLEGSDGFPAVLATDLGDKGLTIMVIFLAVFPNDADSLDSVVSFADMAMQEIKRTGSGEHILKFTPELLKNEHTLEMEGKLRTALDNDNVFFMLQPQYDMSHKLEVLKQIGCNFVQGYIWGRPLLPKDVELLVSESQTVLPEK